VNGENMAVEMAEQPAVLERLVARRAAITASITALLSEHLCGTVLLARGSSDTAALYGRYLFEMASGRPVALAAAKQAWRTRLPPELHPTSYCAAMSEQVLDEAARNKKPFFLVCSFAEPHHPFVPPGKYWDMYKPAEVALPRSFEFGPNRPPPHVAALLAERDAGRALKHTPQLFACTAEEAREAIALNYGSISFIDDAVGRVLARLNALGLDRDTIIVFTADHGDFMGDHQLLLKGPIHYRGIIQAPFLWRDPEGPRGRRSDALCGTIDLAQTILARAGVTPFNGMQGRDLAPLFSGAAASVHDEMLIEEEGQRPQIPFANRVRTRSLTTIPTYNTNCVCVTFATSRASPVVSRVSQTCVRRPRCSGTLSAINRLPTGAAAKKLVLLSTVVVDWPSRRLSTVPSAPTVSAKAMIAPP